MNLEKILSHTSCFCDIIMDLDTELDEKYKIIQNVNDKMCKLTQNILNLGLLGDERHYKKNLHLINIINEFHIVKGITRIPYIETFCRKLKKYQIEPQKLMEKLKNKNHDNNFEILTPLRYINWIMTE